MLQKITMPAGGQNTNQLTVLKWHKHEGDAVKRGDVLIEVETDKATMEVESFAKGTLLKILVKEGEVATVGDVIAYVGNEGDLAESSDAPKQKMDSVTEVDDYQPIMPNPVKTANEVSVSPISSSERMKATPAAKKAAKENGLDIHEVYKALGKAIIHREDIKEYSKPVSSVSKVNELPYEIMPMTTMRRAIAVRMTQSAFSIPVFTAEIEVDMGACIDLRTELNKNADGIRIAYHDILAKCVAKVAKKHPLINASYEESGVRIYRAVNVGLAISVENGLVVPVVQDIGNKSLSSVARENIENINKAREGRLAPSDMEGGTFTISNLGMYPVKRFTAIINPPQSCILAVGSVTKSPVWTEDGWTARSIMSITASFDHRVVDGACGAEFLKDLKELMEHPTMLLL